MESVVSTIAGNGVAGFSDGENSSAMFKGPIGICCGNDDKIFVTDHDNRRIRMVHRDRVQTIAGAGEKGYGPVATSTFNYVNGICCSKDQILYVADFGNHNIRKIEQSRVTTLTGSAGNPGNRDGSYVFSLFNHPCGICISENDNKIYVADYGNHSIRMIHEGQVTTIAGRGSHGYSNGPCLSAMFNGPYGICCFKERIYVSDYNNHRIRMIYQGLVTTIAGTGSRGHLNGMCHTSILQCPAGLCCTNDGRLYVADLANNRIRMIYRGQVTTVAGNGTAGYNDGSASSSSFDHPTGVCCANDGRTLYISDQNNHRIRMISNQNESQECMTLEALLHFSDLSDLPLVFKGTEFHLHCSFISLICPKLMEKETMDLIQRSNTSVQTFQWFIHYLYASRSRSTVEIPCEYPDSTLTLIELIHIYWLTGVCGIPPHINGQLLDQFIFTLYKNETLTSQECTDALIELHLLKSLHTLHTEKYVMDHIDIMIEHTAEKLRSGGFITPQLIHSMMTSIPAHAFTVMMTRLLPYSPTPIPYVSSKNISSCALLYNAMVVAASSVVPPLKPEVPVRPTRQFTEENWELSKPDFTVEITNHKYQCHKWMLCGRWSYMRSLIQAGLKESQESRLILPDDWTPSRLDAFVRYIYLNEVSSFESFEDCTWLLTNAPLYGLLDSDHLPTREFEPLIQHCLAKTSVPPILSNCIEMYRVAIEIGTDERKNQCRDFIVKEFLHIMNDPSLAAELGRLGEILFMSIAFEHFGHEIPSCETSDGEIELS
jgi:sugar lactone lactonase YvrE